MTLCTCGHPKTRHKEGICLVGVDEIKTYGPVIEHKDEELCECTEFRKRKEKR